MKYTGKLYGKIGGQYIQLEQDTAYVDGLELDNKRMRLQIEAMCKALETLNKHKAQMLELLEDISAPRRGTEAENWQVEPRVIQLAARIVDEVTFKENEK